MSRKKRSVAIAVAILLLAVVLPGGLSLGRDDAGVTVEVTAPPSGLALPVGQAVAVRYRVLGAAAAVELWRGDELLATDPVESGQEVSHAWAATEPGRQCIEVRAVNETDKRLAHAELCLVGLPAGAPVRLGVEK